MTRRRRRSSRASRCGWSSSWPTAGPRSSRSQPAVRDQVDGSLADARRTTGWDGLRRRAARVPRRVLGRAPTSSSTATPSSSRRVRFALFHVLQAGARAEGGDPGQGLTGPGYDGHAFWDTESLRAAGADLHGARRGARDALRWRHCDARPRARRARGSSGCAGAAFPWRTIHGEECSGYWPAGTAAFHINADIADAVVRYVGATGDDGLRARGRASSCWWRPRACGARSATTTARRASASTASPGPTSTAPSPTTTSTRT